MENVKITRKDGFMFFLISKPLAMFLFEKADISPAVYVLYDDDSEALVGSAEDIARHDGQFGLEIGFLDEAVKEFLQM